MTDRTRRARSGSGVRRARFKGGKRSGAGRTPRMKAGNKPIAGGPLQRRCAGAAITRCRCWRVHSAERRAALLPSPDADCGESLELAAGPLWAKGVVTPLLLAKDNGRWRSCAVAVVNVRTVQSDLAGVRRHRPAHRSISGGRNGECGIGRSLVGRGASDAPHVVTTGLVPLALAPDTLAALDLHRWRMAASTVLLSAMSLARSFGSGIGACLPDAGSWASVTSQHR